MSRLLFLPALLWAAAAAPEPSPPAITVVRTAQRTLAETVLVTGMLVPRVEVLVSPQTEGLAITAIAAGKGDRAAATG